MGIRTTMVMWCAAMLTTATVDAAEAVSVDVTADIFGKYIWRGQELNTSSVLQPGIDIGYAGFTGTIWGNLDLTSNNGESGEFTEYNYAIDYSAAVPGIDGLDFSVGAIYYYFPSVDPSGTTEVYWGFGFDVLFSPYFTVYHDVDEAKGVYVEVGGGYGIDELFSLSPDIPVGMELGASIGWGDSDYNTFYWGLNSSKMNDLTLSLSFPMQVSGWTVAPSIHYVTLLSDGVRATNAGGGQNNESLFAGIGFSRRF